MAEVLTENAAIVATELSANMLRHAGGGELMIRAIDNDTFRPVTGQVDQPVGGARLGHGTPFLSGLRDQDPPNCP